MDQRRYGGRIIAVCTSPFAGVPKYIRDIAVMAEFGFREDFHCKPMRRSFSNPGTEKPNTDRHITVVAQEALDEVNEKLGLKLKAGDLGENILVKGLGNLSNVLDGMEIEIQIGTYDEHNAMEKAILVVTGQNKPCKNLNHFHPKLIKEIYGKRGLLCSVKSGIGKFILRGQRVTLLNPLCNFCGYKMIRHRNEWFCSCRISDF